MQTIVTDRTSIETDWKCGMKRWWFLHAGDAQRGIVPIAEPTALRDGIAIHASLAALLEGGELVLPEMPPEADQEQLESWAREVGWLVAFHTHVWPEWFAPFYDIVAIEREMVLDRTPLWIALTADIVLRAKLDQKLVVVDFKSVGWLTREWVDSWPFAIQMHINQLGVAEELGESVSHALVVGLQKGKYDHGKLRHPFVWGYSDGSRWSSAWKSGWGLRPTWEYGDGGAEGIKQWTLDLGREVCLGQFPISAPVVLDRELVESVVADRLAREHEVLDESVPFSRKFEKRLHQCRPTMGSACAYLECCWNRDVGDAPLDSGLYKNRIPHHDVEVD